MSLRQAENRCFIMGILSENNLKYTSFVSKINGGTVEAIGGEIKVRVKQKINDKDSIVEIPVSMYASKYKNDGGPNPAYVSIENVMKNFVSIAACGDEALADKVRISSAEITMNEYYSRTGNLVSFPRIKASFVDKAKPEEYRPQATFSLEFAVSSLDYVTDKDGIEVEPKKLRVKAIVPQYGGKVDTVEMFATNPYVINAITQYWENGKTYTAKGNLNFTVETREIVEECDFGEPEIRYVTRNVEELLITKGTQSPEDDEVGFDPRELSIALKEHKAYLEGLKNKPKAGGKVNAPAPKSSKAGIDLGF